jgi:flagellar hook-associated protein 3 FlgL
MRVSSNTISNTVISQIQTLSSQQAKLQNEVATGQRIFQPEDDPASVGRVLEYDTQQRLNNQYASNADRALTVSQATYSGLQSIKTVSDRATEIGTLGAGAISPDAASAYAAEVNQLIEQTVQLGNTKLGNDYIYGGTAVSSPPFVATRDSSGNVTSVDYAGNSSGAAIALSTASSITATTSGDTNLGIRDFLNHLVALRDALTTNDTAGVTAAQTGLVSTEDQLVSSIAEVGGVQTRIEAAQSQQKDMATNLASLISNETDADMPSTIVKLTQTQTAYQAALQSAASTMKISLLNYIQ